MQKNYLFILVFLLIFTGCSSDKDSLPNKNNGYIEQSFTLLAKDHIPDSDLYIDGGILQSPSDDAMFDKDSRVWQGMPSIGKDNMGNLYAAWITGGKGEGSDNYITLSISIDKGRTWYHDKLVIYSTPENKARVRDPSLFNDKFGNLYIGWAQNLYGKSAVSKPWSEVWYSKLSWSSILENIYFTAPRKIGEGIMLNKPFNSTITDQMVFPIAVWYVDNHVLQQPFMYKGNYGSNNLTGFTKVGGITMDPTVGHHIYEHMFVELRDSTYLGMTRDHGGIYYSKSKDGKTWDVAKKFTATGLNSSARFYLGKLKSGRLILIFNNARTRTNMTVCLSDDDGATWPYKMLFDERGGSYFGVSYPDMIETDGGLLNIVYDYERSPAGTINFVTIREEDIINNTKTEVFRTNISSLR